MALTHFRRSPSVPHGPCVLLDLGRLRTAHEPVLLRQGVDHVVLVTRSTLPAVAAARAAAAELTASTVHGASSQVTCLVVGESRPYSATEISEAIGLPVLGVLPYDVRSAAAFSTGAAGGRRLVRSPLLRAARALAAVLVERSAKAPETQVVGAARG